MVGYDAATDDRTIDAHGWLHMGDLGTMDERGYIRIAGCLKDMIIRGGMNLYPREIEEVLFGHPGGALVSARGILDDRGGEIVAAVVLGADPGSPPDTAELTHWCRERCHDTRCRCAGTSPRPSRSPRRARSRGSASRS